MKNIAALILLLSLFAAPHMALAQDFLNQVQDTGAAVYGENPATFGQTLGVVLAALLSVLGIIFLIIIIYAGFLWMFAGGSADMIKKARNLMINAFIGLLILVSSYAITTFVVELVSEDPAEVEDAPI